MLRAGGPKLCYILSRPRELIWATDVQMLLEPSSPSVLLMQGVAKAGCGPQSGCQGTR